MRSRDSILCACNACSLRLKQNPRVFSPYNFSFLIYYSVKLWFQRVRPEFQLVQWKNKWTDFKVNVRVDSTENRPTKVKNVKLRTDGES